MCIRDSFYAYTLINEKKDDEGLPLYRRSAELGEPRAFFMAGWSYELGRGVEKDARRAAEYYQQALAAPIQSKIGPANRLGAFYYNGDGVEQDYAKAFQLLKWAYDQDTSSNWGAYYLGACCAHGWGTQQDVYKRQTGTRPAPRPMQDGRPGDAPRSSSPSPRWTAPARRMYGRRPPPW